MSTTLHRAAPPAGRSRAHLRRWLHWRLLLWLGGAAGTALWLAARPETRWTHVLTALAAYLILLGAALVPASGAAS